MTAIILAAGVGKRMGPEAPPKCLLKISGRTLLRMTLDTLRAAGIRNVVIVVGYKKEAIIAEAEQNAAYLNLKFVDNPRFREGAILSLWAAREFFGNDLIIMDADVLFPAACFERLVRSVHANAVLVDGSSQDTGEEQMVMGKGNRVLYITKRPTPEQKASMATFGESIGFLKVSKDAAAILHQLLEQKINAGVVQIEHEQVYPDLFQQVFVGYEAMDGIPWMEIDTPEDLQRAEREVHALWKPQPGVNRILSNACLPVILKFPFSPNQWTFLSLMVGLIGLYFMAQGSYLSMVQGALLFQLFYLMDNWDGDVARARGISSWWGGWMDIAVDFIIQILLPFSLALGLYRQGGAPEWVFLAAWSAGIGIFFSFLVPSLAKLRGFGPSVYGDSSRGKIVATDSTLKRWIRANQTNENFSLIVIGVALLRITLPFLCLLAIGTHAYWINFLIRERRRLFPL